MDKDIKDPSVLSKVVAGVAAGLGELVGYGIDDLWISTEEYTIEVSYKLAAFNGKKNDRDVVVPIPFYAVTRNRPELYQQVAELIKWFTLNDTNSRAEDLGDLFLSRHQGHEIYAYGLGVIGCKTCQVEYEIDRMAGALNTIGVYEGSPSLISPMDTRINWGIPDCRVLTAPPGTCHEEYWTWTVTDFLGKQIATGLADKNKHGNINDIAREAVWWKIWMGVPY